MILELTETLLGSDLAFLLLVLKFSSAQMVEPIHPLASGGPGRYTVYPLQYRPLVAGLRLPVPTMASFCQEQGCIIKVPNSRASELLEHYEYVW